MVVASETGLPIQYPKSTLQRAKRAMRCSPFCFRLFQAMTAESVALNDIAGKAGVRNLYVQRQLSELAAEGELLWLIRVGLLRREVDGQGLTDRFRVTPLGRQIVFHWESHQPRQLERASLIDHFYNAWSRWVRLPF